MRSSDPRPLFLLALAAACEPYRGVGAAAPEGRALRVTIQRGPFALTVGRSDEIVIAVARDGDDAFDGDVELSIASEPGIVATAATLQATSTSAVLVVTAAPERRHGRVTLRIAARSPLRAGEIVREVMVRGPPGALDTSFGDQGIFALGVADAEATGAAAVEEGKTLLAGRVGRAAVVVRLLADGTLDPAFGEGGVARLGVTDVVSVHDVVVTKAAISVGGVAGLPGRTFIAQLDRSGAAVAAFGEGGLLVAHDQAESRALAAAADGALLVGGRPAGGAGAHVVRYFAEGVVDGAWANEGTFLAPDLAPCPLVDDCFVGAIAPKQDGRLTICESRGDGVVFHELRPDGTPDPDYEFTTTPDVLARCTSIVGSPVDFWVAGTKTAHAFAVAHLGVSPTGGPLKLDPYFTPPTFEGVALDAPTRVAIGGPGYIVLATRYQPPSGPAELALVRLHAYGAIDPAFADGKSWTSVAIGGAPASAKALAVGADGRVVVAGTNGDAVAARFWQ